MKLPRAKSDVEERELGGECLLYDPESKKVHLLNKTALMVWRACDGKKEIEELAEEIKKEFSPPADVDVVADIKESIQELRSLKLLED